MNQNQELNSQAASMSSGGMTSPRLRRCVLLLIGLGFTSFQSALAAATLPFTNSMGVKFVQVPSGVFKMGQARESCDRDLCFTKTPAHEVRISQPFGMSVVLFSDAPAPCLHADLGEVVRKIVVKIQDAHLPASALIPATDIHAAVTKESVHVALNP